MSFRKACTLLLACVAVALSSCSFSNLPSAKGPDLKPQGRAQLDRHVKVLLTGDSLMYSLGPQMKESLSGYEGLTLIPIGKSSSGLSRPDFHNWPAVLEKHLREDRPDVVVMWIGTNDAVDIYGTRGVEPCTKAWQKLYSRKMWKIIRLTRQYNARLVWMGPPVRDVEPRNSQLRTINRLMKWVAKRTDCYYVDTRSILSDMWGAYKQRATMPDGTTADIRTADHVHITVAGNKLIMAELLPVLSRACEAATHHALYSENNSR